MNLSKAVAWMGVSFVAFFVLSSPNDAGGVVDSAFAGLWGVWDVFGDFIKWVAG